MAHLLLPSTHPPPHAPRPPPPPPPETGPTNGTFTITLDTPAPVGGLVVNFDTTGSTATNPSHYSLTEGTNIKTGDAHPLPHSRGATTAVLNAIPVDDAIINP